MKLYGHFFSSPANQTRYAAGALGLNYDYEHVDLSAGQQKTPEFLKMNPFGKVPTLEDEDGFTLAESNAICRYLACKQESTLYPNDAKARANIDQWMDYSSQHVRMNVGKVLFNKVLAPMIDAPVDEKSMADGREQLTNNLPVIEETLGKNAYLTGDSLTIADIALTAAMDPLEAIEFDLPAFPNIAKWRQNNMAQDWYQNVHAHFMAELKG